MINYAVIMIICEFIDRIFSYIAPYDYSLMSMNFVTQMGFMALMLISRKCTFKNALILAVLLGVMQDIYGNITFGMYVFVNVAMVFLAYFWTNNMTDTWFENLLFVLIIIFVRDIVIYLIMQITGITNMDIMKLINYRCFLTLAINGGLFFVVNYLVHIAERWLSDKDVELRKKEKIFMYDLHEEQKK